MVRFRLVSLFGTAALVVGVLCAQSCSKGSVHYGGTAGTLSEDFVKALLDEGYSPTFEFIRPAGSTQAARDATSSVRSFVRRISAKFATSLFGSCTADVEGDKTDADRDAVWVNAKSKVDCSSGADRIVGELKLKDQDDTQMVPFSGLSIAVSNESFADLGVGDGKRLHIVAKASEGELKVTDSLTTGTASAEATFSGGSWSFTLGADVNGSYQGRMTEPHRKEGDKGEAHGYVRFASSAVERIPNADFVLRLDGTFTMGKCGSSSDVNLKTGEATILDGSGNRLQMSATECLVTFIYNGRALNKRIDLN